MKSMPKKAAITTLAAVFAFALSVPALSFAESSSNGAASSAQEVAGATSSGIQTATGNAQADDAGNCTVTLQYYENVNYEDPDVIPDEEGRVLMGTRVLTGLHEGDTIDTWDYVADIPGYFFFDAWPATLKVSIDPMQNIIKLFYFKAWDSEYTVNYYLIEGADLSADSWEGALGTGEIEFLKMGSQNFEHQRFDSLVKGDAYEYHVDGMYMVDSYPPEIRLTEQADDNVINVFYLPATDNLPDDIPDVDSPEAVEPDPAPEPGSPEAPTLPGDAVIDKDDLETILPDSSTPGADEIIDDILGAEDAVDTVVTDEMLENTIPKAEARKIAQAYRTGLHQGSELAQTGDAAPVVAVVLVIAAAAAAAVAALLLWRKHARTHE